MPPTSSRWRHAPALIASVAFVAPTVLMVVGSLRNPDLAPPRGIDLFPSAPTLESYERAFEFVDIARYTLNSLIVTGIAVPVAVIVASWAALGMLRLSRRWQTTLVVASLIALMVPITALMVPRFAIFRSIGLAGTYVPLIAPALIGMSPFYVLIYYRAFRRLPTELFDAARIEGASLLRTWRTVAMPLVQGATVAVAVLAFAMSWGNLLDPLVYLYDERMFTLPIGLKSLALLDPHNFPVMLAGAVLSTLPVVVLFIAAQRRLFEEART